MRLTRKRRMRRDAILYGCFEEQRAAAQDRERTRGPDCSAKVNNIARAKKNPAVWRGFHSGGKPPRFTYCGTTLIAFIPLGPRSAS